MEPHQHVHYHQQQQLDCSSNGGGSKASFLCRQSSTRWIPTSDQIRILRELYYNNGIRSPNADQIQKISARLRQYGKIEGKNVFYWFQNYKARERQKKRLTVDVILPPSGSGNIAAAQSGMNNSSTSTSTCNNKAASSNLLSPAGVYSECSSPAELYNTVDYMDTSGRSYVEYRNLSSSSMPWMYNQQQYYDLQPPVSSDEHEAAAAAAPAAITTTLASREIVETLPLFPIYTTTMTQLEISNINNDDSSMNCYFPGVSSYNYSTTCAGQQQEEFYSSSSNNNSNGAEAADSASLELTLNSCYSCAPPGSA